MPSDRLSILTAIVVALVVTFLVLLGSRGSPLRRALSLGAAASIGFALLAAITKSMTDVLVKGWAPLFGSWQLYALAIIGLGSFIIMQSAFQVGPFAASQASLILVNPFVSMLIGGVLFGETLRGGPTYVSLEVLSLVVMVFGALGLSSSSLVANVHEESVDQHLLRGRGQFARWRTRHAALK